MTEQTFETVAFAARRPVLTVDESDLTTAGAQVIYDPDEAEIAGAFVEDALSEADAWDANADELVAEGGERNGE